MTASLTSVTFDGFYASVERSTPIVTFDLSPFRFITPGGMMLLAIAVEQATDQGQQPVLVLPSGELRKYLARAGFLDHLGCNTACIPVLTPSESIPYRLRRGSSPLLQEFSVVTGVEQLSEVLEKLVRVLRFRLKYRKRDAYDIAIVMSELWQNSLEHSSSPVRATGIMQMYRTPQRRLEIALGDNGDGILKSLRRNSNYQNLSNDNDAIIKAFEPSVSEHQDRTRGNGLVLLVDKIFAHDGTAEIRSGTGKVRIRADQRRGWKLNVPYLKGTQVVISLAAK